MSFLTHLSDDERERCLQLVAQAGQLRSREQFSAWLQGEVQGFLQHDMLVAAWSDLQRGVMKVDIFSGRRGLAMGTLDTSSLSDAIGQAFSLWVAGGRRPCAIDAEAATPMFAGTAGRTLPVARSALVHGSSDQRSGHEVVYIVLGQQPASDARVRQALDFLLPFVDTALRQVTNPPTQASGFLAGGPGAQSHGAVQITLPPPPTTPDTNMTQRERQIMRWVEMGKTNQEIGTILDISAFTVKNHMQRIFKKLDVYSRAQAVSRFKDSMLHG